MQIMQSRRDFLASLSAAGAAGVLGARGSLADEGPPEMTTIRLQLRSRHLRRAHVHRRGAAACGRVHRHPLRAATHGSSYDAVARGEIDFELETSRHGSSRTWMPASRSRRSPACIPGASSCSRTSRIRTHQRPEGQEGRHPAPRARARTLYLAIMAAHVGLDPAQGHRLDRPTPVAHGHGAVRRGQVDAFLALPARAAGAARPQDRPRDPQHAPSDRPWSQYFCCMLFGNRDFVRELSGRDQARAARHPQGHRHLRRRAGAGRATVWSMAGSRSATTTRSRR